MQLRVQISEQDHSSNWWKMNGCFCPQVLRQNATGFSLNTEKILFEEVLF